MQVGVLIGKAGETIRYLQYNSGAKIQIVRDAEADLSSTTRPVELTGSLDSINKAEKLIRDVIAEVGVDVVSAFVSFSPSFFLHFHISDSQTEAVIFFPALVTFLKSGRCT